MHGLELDELQRFDWRMAKAFGLDRRIANYQGVRSIALERTEPIYCRLMQAHIDHGRKTYATGAYYCVLLGEIAVHEGRLAAFRQWYEGFMEGYSASGQCEPRWI